MRIRRRRNSMPMAMASSIPERDASHTEDNILKEAPRKEETHDVLDEVDGFEKDSCIRCDENGDLLVCTEIGCPIALHEYCMSCQPSFDEAGHFYCPYCAYKRAVVRVNELRRRAMVKKRGLPDFLDVRLVSGDNSPQVGEAGRKKVKFKVSTCGVDAHLETASAHHDVEKTEVEDADHEAERVSPDTDDGGEQIQPGKEGMVESHLADQSSRDRDMQVELNQSNEGEDHARTAEDDQPVSMLGDNVENHDGPIVSIVSNGIHPAPEVQPCVNSRIEEKTQSADISGAHQVESLEDKEDGKTMEDSSMSTDDIVDEEILKDHGHPDTVSANHDEEETEVEDVDHEAERVSPDTDDDGAQTQPGKEGMVENIDIASVNNDLKNETTAKKKRFKIKANRNGNRKNSNSPRMSLRIRTPNHGKKSPHIRTPKHGKKSPHIQTPKPGKNLATKMEKVSPSSKRPKPAFLNQLKDLDLQGGRRKRMFWSNEEEEMLKEGVERFSSTSVKNLPWKKILEFGSHIFHDTRTPSDLKDKWRNIQAK